MKQNIIVCDKCSHEFEPPAIKFKTVDAAIDGKDFEIVYYTCPNCGEQYIVCMLDYMGKKLQKKVVDATDAYRAAYHAGKNPVKLKQKLERLDELKAEAMDYQKSVLSTYGKSIPEGLLV